MNEDIKIAKEIIDRFYEKCKRCNAQPKEYSAYKEIQAIENILNRLEELEQKREDGTLSDGYHTFNDLYYQRCILFATICNNNKNISWKSKRHSDGELCFGNDKWFIVGIDTPEGSYTYHYETKYWDLFDVLELEKAKEWDGHTDKDVTRLLSLKNGTDVCLHCEEGIGCYCERVLSRPYNKKCRVAV